MRESSKAIAYGSRTSSRRSADAAMPPWKISRAARRRRSAWSCGRTSGRSSLREAASDTRNPVGVSPAGLSRGAVISAGGGGHDGDDRPERHGAVDASHGVLRHPERPREGGNPRVVRLQRSLVEKAPRAFLSDGTSQAAEERGFRSGA